MIANRHWPLALLLILCLSLAAGCGNKGPVRPLAQPLPAPPAAMSLHQQGDGLLLSWQLPRHNQDGSELTDLAGFRIYREAFDPADDCPDCRDRSELWRIVELDYLRHARRSGDRLFVADSELQAGRGYRYKVVPFNRWGQDGPAIERRQALAVPPPAPAAPTAQQGDGSLLLSWPAANALPEGMELLGYNLYRRRPGRAFTPAPRNRELLVAPRFEDRGFEPDHSYVYAVRLVVRQAGRVLESALSDTLVITPQGRF